MSKDTKSRVTAAQTNVLCTFFEENPEVIRGYKKTPKCVEAVQTKWKKITPHLNSLGPPRHHKAWAKYLCDLKAKLKRKRIKWRQNSDGSGPIICNADDFNEIGLRMLQVLRRDSLSLQETQKMPRHYVPKPGTKRRTPLNSENLKKAVNSVINKYDTVKGSAKKYGIHIMTLKRYVKKKRENKNNDICYSSNYSKSTIFTNSQEISLRDYLIEYCKLHCNVSNKQIRKLSYDFAIKNKMKTPNSWKENEEAGYDWFYGFKNRHPQFSMCSPEPVKLIVNHLNINKSNVAIDMSTEMDSFEEGSFKNLFKFEEGDSYPSDMEESTKDDQEDEGNYGMVVFPLKDTKNNTKATNNQIYTKLVTTKSDPELQAPQVYVNQTECNDEFDMFGKNIAQQLRTLPLAVALETQEILLSVMRKQRLKVLNESHSVNTDPLDKIC